MQDPRFRPTPAQPKSAFKQVPRGSRCTLLSEKLSLEGKDPLFTHLCFPLALLNVELIIQAQKELVKEHVSFEASAEDEFLGIS